ncbi:unnamed protein product [Microthlaspi erraticum]|uniref:Pentacotripeptide-repeat region of PRORP domain-containing protein n=1 Tax=Microthlaspi erraticum TaxID=1685480 RepID=A0A6D2I3M2_9BRAS|nr:unnamed protein product [Microthlaspi erraticum]CAA7023062.1 unnamed protein product [Microthlaspi erraticum]
MSVLRRIVQSPTVSNAAKAFIPYPLGREPSSVPKIFPIYETYIDRRPISLRYRVTAMIEMCNLDEAATISHLAVVDRFRNDRDTVFICNSVIGAMCKAKRYEEALSLFNYFFNESQVLPNTLSCNLIMKAHCDQGRVDVALELYRHMVLDGRVSPGIETYKILTEALVAAKRFDEACALERSMKRRSFMVYDILIRGFLDAGRFVEASQIFEDLKEPNSRLPWREYHKAIAVFSASFMRYWLKQGKDEEAMEIYKGLDKPMLQVNPIVGNRILQVLVEHGKKTVALDLFEEMICNSETVDIIFKGFSDTIVPFDFEWLGVGCYGTMIKRLCEQGRVSEAEELFADMFSDVERDEHLMAAGPDVSTFRAMINGYVKVGRVDDAMNMLDKMKISTLRKLAIHRAS